MAPGWIVARAVARTIAGVIGGVIGGVIARVIAIAITVAMSSPCWLGSADAQVRSIPATASASASAAAVAASAASFPRRGSGTGNQTETRTATGTATGSANGTATTPVMPRITDEDIRRVQREARTPTPADIEAVRRQHGTPGVSRDLQRHPGLATAQGQPSPSSQAPRIDALPLPLSNTPIDIEAIARGYAAQAEGPPANGATTAPGLLVFVSLSMPRPTLQRLLAQAARARAAVVLRGFVNGSLRETVQLVQPLLGATQVALQIDPPAFDRFDVQRVPTFVLVRDGARPQSCASGTCAPAADFVRVAGDVSLDYALAHMRLTRPDFRHAAQLFLARLAAHGVDRDGTGTGIRTGMQSEAGPGAGNVPRAAGDGVGVGVGIRETGAGPGPHKH
ncbi:type-F conjugative transfer system pilin assembly protein TrbC [Roseateles chitinivorans]|uniref:type-F conjugative transfer system pilin assembly protein TrbC n=1 Tax=Roseateles chitinivorans TaxID=2917965 RepID=UPI003D67226A